MAQIAQASLLGPFVTSIGNRKVRNLAVKPNKDAGYLKRLVEIGKVKPVIDRCFPLSEAVDALRYYEDGHSAGKVIVTIQ